MKPHWILYSEGFASLTSSGQAVPGLCVEYSNCFLCAYQVTCQKISNLFFGVSLPELCETSCSYILTCLSASENQLAQSIHLNANQAVDDVAVKSVFHSNKRRVRCLCSTVQWCLPVYITYRGEIHCHSYLQKSRRLFSWHIWLYPTLLSCGRNSLMDIDAFFMVQHLWW